MGLIAVRRWVCLRATGRRGCVLGLMLATATAAAAPGPQHRPEETVATVGDQRIDREVFEAQVHAGLRQRFFHRRPSPEAELAFRREVAERLVDELLLAAEARRRGLAPDQAAVAADLARYEARYRQYQGWRQQREGLLADLRERLEQESLLAQLRALIEAVERPDEATLRGYYAAHPEMFTTPERLRVSMILLRVEPWAPGASWTAAMEEAERLRAKIEAGADFGELAQLHSADASAAGGGDLGELHRGMLAEPAQQAVDGLAPGQVSEPVRLLQGVALFRLDGREAPRRNPYADVEARVVDLWSRDRREQVWQDLVRELRAAYPVVINESIIGAVETRDGED